MDIRQKGNKYYRNTWWLRLIDFVKGGGYCYLVGIAVIFFFLILVWGNK